MKHPILIAVTFIGALSIGWILPFLDVPQAPLPDHLTADWVIVENQRTASVSSRTGS